MSGWFSQNEALIQNALVTALLAYSLQVALRAGVFSFAGVGFYGIAAYGVGYLLVVREWDAVPAILAIMLLTAVLALGLGLILARLRALYLAMATLALVLLVRTTAIVWTPVTGGSLGLLGVPPVFGTTTVIILVVVVASVAAIMQRARLGRRYLVLRTDEALAGATGVDVRRNHLVAVVLSSLIGGLAGISHIVFLEVFTPENVDFSIVTDTLTALVIGGTFHWAGPIIGGFIFAWLPQWLAGLEEWRIVVQGAVVIAMIVYFPGGIAGLLSEGVALLRGRLPGARVSRETAERPPDDPLAPSAEGVELPL